jgi:NADH-quinone oxidoreductase subunit J
MIGFALLATVMIVGALGVVLLRQPVHAALSLVGTLLALAIVYVTLQAHFLAAVQVIVYAGAIMVLFLFVIMLLNVGDVTGPKRSLPGLRWAAYAAGVVVAIAVAVAVLLEGRPLGDADVVRAALDGGGAGAIGDVLFGDFLLAFHLVGVLLLTGVVGAVALVQRGAQTAHGAPALRPAGDPVAAGALSDQRTADRSRALGRGGRS